MLGFDPLMLQMAFYRVNYPHLSHNDEWSRLWHFTDTSYGLPKCTIYLWISSPVSYRTPADFAYMDLMVECFKVIAVANLSFIL